MFKKKAEPKVFEAQIKYDPDLQTLIQLKEGIIQLDTLKTQKRITDKQYQAELAEYAKTIEKLEAKYVEQSL